MRDAIKAFLVASSLAFGIPTFVDADPPDRARDTRHEIRALRLAALSPRFEAARARSLAETAGKALSDMALMRAQTMSRVAALLTAEQREKLRGLRAL